MTQPLEMSGETLHWKVLLKYIKNQVGGVGNYILERDVIKHFVPEDFKSSQKKLAWKKVEKALKGLYDNGYCSVSLGQTENGTGRVVTLLKYPSGIAYEQSQGDSERDGEEGLSL